GSKNLIGRHLRLGSVEEQPFMFFATEGCEGNDCWSGMVNDMVVKLSEDLGFTYEYIQPDDRKFGALNKTTNEWNGMIRDLLDDKTDMIAIDLSTNSARKSAIDYSFPFMDAGIKAVVKGEGTTLNQVLELLDQDKYKWGVIGSRHPETLLKTHRDSRYSRLVDEGVELKDLNHAIETLRGGLFVFIDEGPVLAHNLISDCDVFSVGEEFQSFEYAFGLPKDSPYKSLIDSHLLKFREEGFIDILWEKWSSGNSVCS
uniref:ML032222a iGluR n=1 Tax=Mnemiopsis leidyi TaxID=27923 RepID=A0A0R4I973_MNELE|nr:Chain A, ML032222a iGluR [Mnemiopsis leidyi]4YKI_B Chain B, ML032222a iGluR [Mnemiopsis leidyi]4YKJ_A Chain A, ML032222a iGluR [Mnemiopsis leidyi]4YKJ_B Chain B, ML032222a iGluR [Mnemiopsis leidyi]4YKK_A Chain A, ML032222a iGluR [Mnemiopsis leidyi]4YKK_B Chain B, ML032222a iGluR [Mnemiopsis leidyi]4YKP_A Chain A, ML032222a iGluR [Mnemiopsis leidyi]4YKP_B Chain B, ML032222a iGluR [Mnemiopsis leidyi]